MESSRPSNVVVPGDFIGDSAKYSAGDGCYKASDGIRASLCGVVTAKNNVLSVKSTCTHVVPREGSLVLCRVLSINSNNAKVRIICVNGKVSKEALKGIIRREDIRATEIDSVEVYNSFRPGDIVRARVLGLGESQGYVLTTAENELGVIMARNSDNNGGLMDPISWCEVQDRVTGKKQKRKVAKLHQTTSSI